MRERSPRFVLGSGSPRRREILEFFHVPFEVAFGSFHEESIPWTGDPRGYVTQLACAKAEHLASHGQRMTLLCADTAVFLEGEVLNKPSSPEEAHAMLRRLAGREHRVWTGVCVRRGDQQWSGAQESIVWMRPLSEQQIELYQNGLHTLDKAGGYAIQGAGSIIVDRLEGCFYNVMGLPLRTTEELLRHGGIDLWQGLSSSSS